MYSRNPTDGTIDFQHITIMIMLQPVNPAAGRCNAKARDSILCLFRLSLFALIRCCIHSCILMTVPCLHFTSILIVSRYICTRYFLLRTTFSYDLLGQLHTHRLFAGFGSDSSRGFFHTYRHYPCRWSV